jgi:hypothetical protein
MTLSDFEQLERSLGIRLPDPYRQAMLVYPFPLDSPAAEFWLPDDAKKTFETNRQIRTGTTLNRRPWPRHLIAIGDDGGEEIYLLDCATSPYAVLVFEIETGKTRPYVESFTAFLDEQWKDLRDLEEDERWMAQAYRDRKWWQFWIRPYPPRRAR